MKPILPDRKDRQNTKDYLEEIFNRLIKDEFDPREINDEITQFLSPKITDLIETKDQPNQGQRKAKLPSSKEIINNLDLIYQEMELKLHEKRFKELLRNKLSESNLEDCSNTRKAALERLYQTDIQHSTIIRQLNLRHTFLIKTLDTNLKRALSPSELKDKVNAEIGRMEIGSHFLHIYLLLGEMGFPSKIRKNTLDTLETSCLKLEDDSLSPALLATELTTLTSKIVLKLEQSKPKDDELHQVLAPLYSELDNTHRRTLDSANEQLQTEIQLYMTILEDVLKDTKLDLDSMEDILKPLKLQNEDNPQKSLKNLQNGLSQRIMEIFLPDNEELESQKAKIPVLFEEYKVDLNHTDEKN